MLISYFREWDLFFSAVRYINSVCRYLNRFWVMREINEGKGNIYYVYTLCSRQWRAVIVERLSARVMDVVLEMLKRQRQGETIEHGLIKKLAESYMDLGVDEQNPTEPTNLNVYRKYFEKPVIKAAREFYGKLDITDDPVGQMALVEAHLEEETERMKLWLREDRFSTYIGAIIELDLGVLKGHLSTLLGKKMYRLLSYFHVHAGWEDMAKPFESYVWNMGSAEMQLLAAGLSSIANLQPDAYVSALLKTYRACRQVVKVAFDDDSLAIRSLQVSFSSLVNGTGDGPTTMTAERSVELLVKYAHMPLAKKTAVPADVLEADLENIKLLILHVDDRAVFARKYARILERRILYGNDATTALAKSVVAVMRDVGGSDYVCKLEGMLVDVQKSGELTQRFRQGTALASTRATYSILSTNHWPPQLQTTFKPPDEMAADRDHFSAFYHGQSQNRKLTWAWHLSRGELKASYGKDGRCYTLRASMYQMAVLLLFNEKDTHEFHDIQTATLLDPEILDSVLSSLVREGLLLLLLSADDGEPSGGPAARTYGLNDDFSRRDRRVTLQVERMPAVPEATETARETREDRLQVLRVRLSLPYPPRY